MSLILKRRPPTIIVAWDEPEQMWFRYRAAGVFHNRYGAERWIKKHRDVDGLIYLAVPNDQDILKSLEGI